MHDVARLAGVSQSTVSLVLNGVQGKRISEETRARVLRSVAELGYRVNSAAKSLREGHSRLIGFVGDMVASTPFAGEIIESAQDRAWADGYLMLIVNTGGDRALEERAIDSLLSRQVDGIVYAAMYHRRLKVPPALREVPTVVLNAETDDESLPAVIPDEYGGGRTAAQHLIDQGHERIGFININTLASKLPAAVDRERGFVDAVEAAGLRLDRTLIRHGDGDAEAGYRHACRLLSRKRRPTAIFCGNDRTAWGAYQAAAELGLRVPRDLSIIGFDNQTLIAAHLRPGLTTMALPFAEMGRRGVASLLSGSSASPIDAVNCPLVERSSVAAPGVDA
ncbi:LacI family DNA-binding transcriptional regulator [Micromonospora sp. NPDC048930]|uniref:LacI family DNA-binding transcriptional regulator n=1 Tax=Micromonospora sp. NPDC048930 TaxID=3364261 RepID=UPI003715C825